MIGEVCSSQNRAKLPRMADRDHKHVRDTVLAELKRRRSFISEEAGGHDVASVRCSPSRPTTLNRSTSLETDDDEQPAVVSLATTTGT
jgi:hypothetical protein